MVEVSRTQPVYPVGVITELLGLSARQVRYYEEVGLVVPARTKGRQRLYSTADVEALVRVKSLIDTGRTVEQVKELLKSEEEWEGDLQVLLKHQGEARSLYPVDALDRVLARVLDEEPEVADVNEEPEVANVDEEPEVGEAEEERRGNSGEVPNE